MIVCMTLLNTLLQNNYVNMQLKDNYCDSTPLLKEASQFDQDEAGNEGTVACCSLNTMWAHAKGTEKFEKWYLTHEDVVDVFVG